MAVVAVVARSHHGFLPLLMFMPVASLCTRSRARIFQMHSLQGPCLAVVLQAKFTTATTLQLTGVTSTVQFHDAYEKGEP